VSPWSSIRRSFTTVRWDAERRFGVNGMDGLSVSSGSFAEALSRMGHSSFRPCNEDERSFNGSVTTSDVHAHVYDHDSIAVEAPSATFAKKILFA